MKKYLAGEAKKTSKKVAILKVPNQTVSELAKEYYERRLASGKSNARGERRWFELHVEPMLGAYLPKSVTPDDADRVLLECKAKGLSLESATRVRAEMSRLWKFLLKGNHATVNVGELSDLPEIDEDERPREILTDAEFERYLRYPDELAWTPTKEAARKAEGKPPLVDREVKTMATIARCVGGARTSDLHALTWEAIDTAGWQQIKIYRPKTKKSDTYFLPELVVPVLQQWWADQKRATSGPVFPTRSNGGRKRADGSEKTGKRVKAS